MAKRKISGIIDASEHPMNLETPWNQKQPDGTYHAYAGDDIEAFLKNEISNRTPTEELVSGETKPPTSGTVFDAMVKNGTLVIDYKEKNVKNVKNLIFYITAPDLSKVKIDGVGNFDAKEKLNLKNIAFELDGVGNCNVKNLHCDELKLDVDGVGNMKMNVDCGLIKAKVDGVGNITLSGKTDTAFFKKDGVGKINYKNLKCKDITKKGWNF